MIEPSKQVTIRSGDRYFSLTLLSENEKRERKKFPSEVLDWRYPDYSDFSSERSASCLDFPSPLGYGTRRNDDPFPPLRRIPFLVDPFPEEELEGKGCVVRKDRGPKGEERGLQPLRVTG